MKKLLIALLLSLAVVGCSKTYPVTYITVPDDRNDNGIKNPVTIHFAYPSTTQTLLIFSNGEMVFNNSGSFTTSDSIVVADSAFLFARWGNNHADTIASPGLHWTIH